MRTPFKRKLIAISLFLIMLIFFGSLLTRSREPSFEGKTLSEWLSQYKQERNLTREFKIDAPEHSNSVRAIRAIGTNCVPTMLKWLDAKDIPGVSALESSARWAGWKSFHIPNSDDKCDFVSCTIAILDRKSDPDLRETCTYGNSGWGREDPRWNVITTLKILEPEKEIGLPIITHLVHHGPDTGLRGSAALCLRELYPDEAERSGIYQMFPQLKISATNIAYSNKVTNIK